MVQSLNQFALMQPLRLDNRAASGCFVCGDNMKTIPLTQGYIALVDDYNYEWLSSMNWSVAIRGKSIYAQQQRRKDGGLIYMHSLLIECPPGFEIDHKDRNGCNNQIDNLRIATHSQNQINCTRPNKTGYRGIYKVGNSWAANIQKNGKRMYLGCFQFPEKAAQAYDTQARELHGEFARLNFPNNIS